MQLLELRRVEVRYQKEAAVKNISFGLEQGEILGIAGESGSGKSTILKAVMGLLSPWGLLTAGDILYRGCSLPKMNREELRAVRGPEIGMIFQNSAASLCPVRIIGSQLYEILRQHGKISKKQMEDEAELLLDMLKLYKGRELLKRYPFELSAGMSQRIGIMMAMMMKPRLLLADEPTSALDVVAQAEVVKALLELKETRNTSMVVVSHHLGMLSQLADCILVLKDGRMVEYGRIRDVLVSPKEAYTKELIQAALLELD